jgi:hypothetical protein
VRLERLVHQQTEVAEMELRYVGFLHLRLIPDLGPEKVYTAPKTGCAQRLNRVQAPRHYACIGIQTRKALGFPISRGLYAFPRLFFNSLP